MKRIYFLILIFIANYFLSQNFKESEIITTNGKILKGYVNYTNPYYTPQEFSFKETIEDKTTKIFDKTSAILVNIIGLKKYKLEKYEVSRHSENLQNLDLNKEFNLYQEDGFLEVLVEGNSNLYLLANKYGNRYFYSTENNTDVKPLLYKEYFNESGTIKYSNNQYLTDLDKLNCGDQKLPEKYTRKDLVNYFQNINTCKGGKVIVNKEEKTIKHFKILAAYNFYKQKPSYSNSKNSFSLGLEYELNFNNFNYLISVVPQFKYTYINAENINSSTNESYNYTFNLALLFKFNLIQKKNNSFYIGLAPINVTFANKKVNNIYFVGNENVTALYGNMFLETGFRFSNFEIFSNYFIKSNLDIRPIDFSIGIKYIFNKKNNNN